MSFVLLHLAFPAFLVVAAGLLQGAWTWSWLALVPLYAACDHLVGIRADGRPARSPAFYRRVLYAGVAVQAGLLVFGAWAVQRMAPWELLGFCVWGGIAGAVLGIVVGHELVHKRERRHRLLGGLMLSMVGYPSFVSEHSDGHHRWVATPHDPSTAPRGMSLYAFLWRAMRGNPRNAVRLQAARLRERGLPPWSPRNELAGWVMVTTAIAASLGLLFGLKGMMFFGGQAFFAVVALEALNYVEHYGLERARRPDGSFEAVGPQHSWSALQTTSNVLLINVQRHADHHVNPERWYPELRPLQGGPLLPTGYPGMIALALIPPLWRRIMDPRLEGQPR